MSQDEVSVEANAVQISQGQILNITLLASEWKSSAGGLSTLNRELAIHLAQIQNVRVSLLVPEGACDNEDKREARSFGISILDAKKCIGVAPLLWLTNPPPDHKIDVIFGHGVKLGCQVQYIKRCAQFQNCKWVQVVHTVPEDLSKYKGYGNPISRGEEKHWDEVDLCKCADLVVPVGPRLAKAYHSYLQECKKDEDFFELVPGLFEREFGDLPAKQKPKDERDAFIVLLCGRGDEEDFELKGYDTAVMAFADRRLKGKRYSLLFVGSPEGRQDEVRERLLNCGIDKKQLMVREFVKSRRKMMELFCEVDMVIMPSKSEGFGLVAIEALSAGLPILVGSNSEFARAIMKIPYGKYSIVRDSGDPAEWAEAIEDARDRHGVVLQENRILKENYGKEYCWKTQCEELVDRLWKMENRKSKMRHRGICLLINNVKDLTAEGNLLTKLFSSLGFNVEVKRDLSMTKIIEVAQEFAKKDHRSYDLFVFIVLSECRPGKLIVGVDGREVILKQVMSEFRPCHSTSLKNKPKLFFVLRFVNLKTQTAEGRSGGTEFFTDTIKALPHACNTSKQEVCPEEADFLLACATSPIVKGEKIKHPQPSFSEMMVDAVSRYHDRYDLLEMLTLLNHWTDNLHKKNGQSNVVVPYVTHTLRDKVRFDFIQTHEPQISTQSSIPGLPSLSRYDEHKTECPGYCVIINNRQFQGNDEAYREGSEQDVERLRKLFKSLRFEVIIKRDLERNHIEGVAQEYGRKNHDKFVAFVLIVMSHGDDEDCVLGVDNKPVGVRALMKEFQAEKCPSLKGKPKILIIQTCRGSRKCEVVGSDGYVESVNAGPTELYLADNRVDQFSLDSSLSKSVFPPETDFLLAFATVPGYVAFRLPSSGALFIQELVEVIKMHHDSRHLLDMLTEVTRRVVDQQNKAVVPAKYRVQVPAPAHTLTKLLFL